MRRRERLRGSRPVRRSRQIRTRNQTSRTEKQLLIEGKAEGGGRRGSEQEQIEWDFAVVGCAGVCGVCTRHRIAGRRMTFAKPGKAPRPSRTDFVTSLPDPSSAPSQEPQWWWQDWQVHPGRRHFPPLQGVHRRGSSCKTRPASTPSSRECPNLLHGYRCLRSSPESPSSRFAASASTAWRPCALPCRHRLLRVAHYPFRPISVCDAIDLLFEPHTTTFLHLPMI
jgi:hypothetical protein